MELMADEMADFKVFTRKTGSII
ncbi:hypothetical protein ACSIGC_17940 (plasmid) [Tenacibaculum sp. ZS6-P6]